MILTQSLGLGYLTAHLIARRVPTVTAAAASSTSGFQRGQQLSTSQTRNYDAVISAKERLQKRHLSRKIGAEKDANPFASFQHHQQFFDTMIFTEKIRWIFTPK